MKLTQKQIKAYVDSKGTHCPFCNSEDISVDGHMEVDGSDGWLDVGCNSCNALWQDVYKLVSVEQKTDDLPVHNNN